MSARVDVRSIDLAAMSLAEVGAAIRDRTLSAREVTQAAIARAEQWQPHLNCFIALEADAALARAAALDDEIARGRWRGPLHGVPLAHKDMFYRAGRISTGGSPIRKDWRAPVTATVLQRLDDAGAVDLGRLNMSEFAAGPTGHNKFFGDCRNPWDRARITGGSSSGSGAAVAARIVYGALGSDTGGSIRMPASANGVLGLKPTYGLVSRHGAMARAWSLDHVGPLARTAEDCAILLAAIAGPDPADSTTVAPDSPTDYVAAVGDGIAALRIGVPDFDAADEDAEIGAALDRACAALAALGARVVRVRLPDLASWYRIADTISKCEAATMHDRWMRERPPDYSDHIRTRIEAGRNIPAVRYIQALALRGPLLKEFLDTTLADADVLLTPAIPVPIPTLAESDVEGTGPAVLALVGRLSRFTRPFNLIGVPAISVPCGFDRRGLPMAFQAVGRPFAEAALLRLAHAYQQATDHHHRAPAL
jgi:aspartyl-tRNA(Asn)/glutamyl-tRNA(Gln) amidotransferase subunit A